jgi:mRNA interferase HigB
MTSARRPPLLMVLCLIPRQPTLPYCGSGGDVTSMPAAQGAFLPIFGNLCYWAPMIVIGTEMVENYLADHAGHKGIKAARSQFDVWLAIAGNAQWRTPEDVKSSHPKASVLKGGRAVFNIKGNDYRLVTAIQYRAGVLVIRFFGTHAEYDKIDAETI